MAESKLTASNWISIGALLVAVVGMAAGLLVFTFPDKSAVHKLDLRMTRTEQVGTYQAHELARQGAQLENLDARQRRISGNIDKLLVRFRVEPEPAVELRAIPPQAPAPAALAPTDE